MENLNKNESKYDIPKEEFIPKGWSKLKLAKLILNISSGISRPFSTENIGLPVLRSSNVMEGRIILDDIKYWFKVDPRGVNLDSVRPQEGDILVNFVNGSRKELGKAAVFRGLPKYSGSKVR